MRRIASSSLQCIRTNQLERVGIGYPTKRLTRSMASHYQCHWDFTDNPADRSRINPVVAQPEDPNAPFGRDPQGQPYTQERYQERFISAGPWGQYSNFPPNNGVEPRTRIALPISKI